MKPWTCSPARPPGSSTPARWRRWAARPATASRCARRSSSPTAAARPRSPPARAADLVATGARPRRARLTDLTAAQERVARLAAGGLGNREIAETLWVTEKTVEGHLGAAYRKLGIGSRSQLGEALRTIPDGLA